MTIKELRMDMMKSKKANPDRAKVLQAILGAAQLIAKEDGNRDATDKDIVNAAKKEIKMAQQSKDAGAPFNPLTFDVCGEFLPKMMNERETEMAVDAAVRALPEKNMKAMGQIMGQLSKEYGEMLDKGIASKFVKAALA
jgi:uncharacterized protein YqeY